MGACVLVVDDLPANRRLLKAVLEPHGYDVVTASDGPEGLELVVEADPDVVILDITMPGMNGYEVCRRIREDPSTARIPVVMVTATGEEEKVRALEAGADDFIRRPFELPELLARVRSLERLKSSHDTIEGQAEELAAWNRTLEQQVAEQVAELDHLRTLERFVPAALGAALRDEGGSSMLEPHRAEVAVVSLGLRGFDEFALVAEPEDVVAVLAAFHDVLGPLVEAAPAIVSGSSGATVTLVVGDPSPVDDVATTAATLACDVVDAMEPLLAPWVARGHPLALEGGVAIGHATMGVIGFEGRRDYAAIGPVTVIAERLGQRSEAGVVCGPLVRSRLDETFVAEPIDTIDLGERLPGIEAHRVIRRARSVPTVDAGLRIGVLGPLEVHVDGVEILITSSRERSLLAALVADAGRVVSVDALAEELWEGDPPESARSTIRVHVSRLRKSLADGGADGVLDTRPPGYRLQVDDGAIDADRFRTATQRAEELAADDPVGAIENYRAGLALWRGAALTEVAASPFGAAASARLEEAKVAAFEACLAIELGVGRHQEVVTQLEGLLLEHPLRDRLRALHMVGLHALGRHADALASFHAYEVVLDEELGASPAPWLAAIADGIAEHRSVAVLIDAASPSPR